MTNDRSEKRQTKESEKEKIKAVKVLQNVVGAAVIAFGVYNVHSISGVTEGGILGLSLFLEHFLSLSPAIGNFVLDALCYLLGWRILGKRFLFYSAVASGSFSVFYAIFERFPRLFPQIAEMPFLAAIVGALFVGLGTGICVRASGAASGDDALAMSLSHKLGCDIRIIYFASDATVLLLSLLYLPPARIAFSALTVILSGQIIGLIQKIGRGKRKPGQAEHPSGEKTPTE